MNDNHEVDIFEKLPVPFGLIRYGVAPDHPNIKNCTETFNHVASHEQCKFYGNITVGKDVMLSDLLQSYHAVILAYGASADKTMGILGENSKNVLSSRQIVGWYTGHPDYVNETVCLNTDVATIIGHGNVAVDVARMLLQDLKILKSTDISEIAYEALKKSQIKKVVMVGRRGPIQVAFTISEFRELSRLPNCHIEMHDPSIPKLSGLLKRKELNLPRRAQRMTQLLCELYEKQNSLNQSKNCIDLKFFRTPKEIIPDSDGRVEKIIFKINEMEDFTSPEGSKLRITDEEDVVNCGLVVRSIGYKSLSIDPSIPFDDKNHVVLQKAGRVLGLYCSGWVRTGPIGVLAQTMSSSFGTAEHLLEDIKRGEIPHNVPKGRDYIFDLLKKKGVKYVTFDDWKKIDKFEKEKGKEMGKEREKFYNVEEVLKFLEESK
ncbi:NADPH:adrenodoxin oxidoreductase, mitochondrial [Caerostris extrusa]|uniref:NADPH:adrenodoxin oxidoreductase, mitochondrial n=1 Tax=Caerostris extrusa TaxID=172846 RepID=A0AAV4QN16_CAEEX|nr:NADPH:adrenodoxin oxidoreductase, mitochondrial [Caerostris extrusa]